MVVCGAFPFLAGQTTTVTNMGIIYTSSPIFIILISQYFFNEKINFIKNIGLISMSNRSVFNYYKGRFKSIN